MYIFSSLKKSRHGEYDYYVMQMVIIRYNSDKLFVRVDKWIRKNKFQF